MNEIDSPLPVESISDRFRATEAPRLAPGSAPGLAPGSAPLEAENFHAIWIDPAPMPATIVMGDGHFTTPLVPVDERRGLGLERSFNAEKFGVGPPEHPEDRLKKFQQPHGMGI